MTKIEFDVLLKIKDNPRVSVGQIANELFVSIETVEKSLSELYKCNMVLNGELTIKAENYLQNHKINNAIILAAGMSTRFVPLNYEIPKGLLVVKGEVLIERQIKQLQEKGIPQIIIVVGYMKERFEYLKDKYGVILVESKEYLFKNNHSSVYCARKYLENSIVTSSDLYFSENIFQTYAFDSYYSCVFMKGHTEERGVWTNDDQMIIKTAYGDECNNVWVTFGYAFFSKSFSKNMISIIKKETNKVENYSKFWADFQDDYLDILYMYSKRVADGVISEFDSLEELRLFDDKYVNNSGSVILRAIADSLETKEGELTNFTLLKDLGQNTFSFKFNDDTYLCSLNDASSQEQIIRGDCCYNFIFKTKINNFFIKIYK